MTFLTRLPCAAALAVLLLLLPGGEGRAQVRGVVADSAGTPVEGVAVELWSGEERRAAARTDDAGRFGLVTAGAEGPLTLSFRRVGFRTRVLDLPEPDTTLAVELAARPVTLPSVVVESESRRRCSPRDDPEARAMWERMRGRYWQPAADTLALFALVELRRGSGARTDAYVPAAGRVVAGWAESAVSASTSVYLPQTGYAIASGGSAGERDAAWRYRRLDHGNMQDFTQDYFGRAHALSVLHRHAGATVLGFCPRERLGASGQIEGTLTIGSDGFLRSARWWFRTRRPEEDAGGEAEYLPPDERFSSALLADETWYWRMTTGGRYYFEARTYSGWRLRGGAPVSGR